MRIAAAIVRVFMGLLFIMASLVYFLNPGPPPELDGRMKVFFDGITAAGYFLPLVKGTELVCGLLLVSGRFVPLSLVVISPIIVNIFMVHLFLERSGLPTAVILVCCNGFLGFYYRKSFRELLAAKTEEVGGAGNA